MSYEGLTDPIAVEDEYGNAIVRFEDGKQIECQSMIEAEALAEAWRQWPDGGHRPVDASRGQWRTGFADGAAWASARAGVVAEEPEWEIAARALDSVAAEFGKTDGLRKERTNERHEVGERPNDGYRAIG